MLEQAKIIQNLLNEAGFKTLAAGGAVRDYLLDREPNDIDLATTAKPGDVAVVVSKNSNLKLIETGIAHGTVTVVLDGVQVQVTTLRVDTACDGREANVEFVKSFELDAARRDLTVNAMFMDLNDKQIYDFVGGKKDLDRGILRFVGDPVERIQEDYLRALRLFRFKSQLAFTIEPRSEIQATAALPSLWVISPERRRDELKKMIVGCGVYDVDIALYNIVPEIIPMRYCKQNCKYHSHDVYKHTLLGVSHLAIYGNPLVSLAHLFHDSGKPRVKTTEVVGSNEVDHFYRHEHVGVKIAEYAMDRLKFSREDIKMVKFLVKNHMRLHSDMDTASMRRFIIKCKEFDEKSFTYLMYMAEADAAGMAPEIKERLKELRIKHRSSVELLSRPTPKAPINGDDLIKMGFKRGPIIGHILSALKDAVIDGALGQNDRAGAIARAELYFKSNPCPEVSK